MSATMRMWAVEPEPTARELFDAARLVHEHAAYRLRVLQARYEICFGAWRACELARTRAALLGRTIPSNEGLRNRVQILAGDLRAMTLEAQAASCDQRAAERAWRDSLTPRSL
jgi:hypothetical protein